MNPFIEERKKENLTQKQMAEKIGVKLYRLQNAEKGEINLETACAFCNEFREYEIREMSIQKRAKISA